MYHFFIGDKWFLGKVILIFDGFIKGYGDIF